MLSLILGWAMVAAEVPPALFGYTGLAAVTGAFGLYITVSRYERAGLRLLITEQSKRIDAIEGSREECTDDLSWERYVRNGLVRRLQRQSIDVPDYALMNKPPRGQEWPRLEDVA